MTTTPTPASDAGRSQHRRRPPGGDVSRVFERDLVVGLLLEPDRIPHAACVVAWDHFTDPRLAGVARVMQKIYATGEPVTLPIIGEELERANELEAMGGVLYLAALVDEAQPCIREHIEVYARRVEKHFHERELAHVLLARSDRPKDAALIERAEMHEAAIEELERGPADVLLGAFTGDRLRAVRERPESISPMPGYLDPAPHLHLIQAVQKTGKTALALWIARAWACGVPPWESSPTLPGSRVLMISREQNVGRIDSTARRLDTFARAGDRETWTDRLFIVARDRDLGRELRRLLTLDAGGIELLRAALLRAKAAGEPFGLVVLDSLSRLKPKDVEENDADAMTAWLDALEELAQECGVYILLVHHVGHADRKDSRSAARGSSAIGAVAQGMWTLERVDGSPQHRLLKIDGNELLAHEVTFEVASATADEGSIHYFRPGDPCAGHEPETYLQAGEAISTNALAWRLADREPEPGCNPPGAFVQMAAKLRHRWARDGLVKVENGPRNAKMISLIEPVNA